MNHEYYNFHLIAILIIVHCVYFLAVLGLIKILYSQTSKELLLVIT